jgi:heat-inducible transcriptional repressor
MTLTIRKQKILCLLVARYIETAEPVSSADIVSDYGEEISSATIRAELAALEKMGYLVQPHVSAGRIPTAKAYKLFVETIPTEGAPVPQIADLRTYLDNKMEDVADVIRSTAQVLSDTTNYTSVIVVKNVGNVRVRDIKLVDIGGDKALVIIITDSGILKDCIIDLPQGMGDSYLKTSSDLLNRMFAGMTVDEIRVKMGSVESEIQAYKDILDQIINSLERFDNSETRVFVEGTSKLLDYPEYTAEVDNMRGVLSLLEHKEELTDMVTDTDLEFNFRIGKDDGIEHGSLVSATYKVSGNREVHAGVIGPERMDYKKVVGVLQYLEMTIKSLLDDKESK